MEQKVIDLYLDTRYGLRNPNVIYQKLRADGYQITQKKVKEILSNLAERQINHGKVRMKLYRITAPVGHYQCDLMFYDQHKVVNRGYHVILSMIEIATRIGYIQPLKNKTAPTIKTGFEAILKRVINKPVFITMDKGSEFINQSTQNFLTDNNIEFSYADTADKHKMGMIERFNRTIRGYVQKLFTSREIMKHSKSHIYNWIDEIENIEYNYNHSVHRAIGKSPFDMSKKDIEQKQLYDNMYNDGIKNDIDLNVGDKVRILNKKSIFDKEGERYSTEVYEIEKVRGKRYYVNKAYRSANSLLKIDTSKLIQQDTTKTTEKKQYDKERKQERTLKRWKIDTSKIIVGKRERKKKEIYDA